MTDPAHIRALQALSYVPKGEHRSPYELAMTKSALRAITRKGWAATRMETRPVRVRSGKEISELAPCYRITSTGRKALAEFQREKDDPKPVSSAADTGRAPDVGLLGHPWRPGGRFL